MTNSQEWVYHDRGGTEPELVRKFQKEAWDMLFKNKDTLHIVHDLNHKFLPCNIKMIVFNINDPIESYRLLKELFQETKFDIHLTAKP